MNLYKKYGIADKKNKNKKKIKKIKKYIYMESD